MPVSAINATAKDAAANSYITLADADQYFVDRPNSALWTAATSDAKTQALLLATKILDTRVRWKGMKTTALQALLWPRAYVDDPNLAQIPGQAPFPVGAQFYYYLDADTIPLFLKWAQCEQALALLGGDVTLDPDTQGFSSLSVGSISVTVDKLSAASVLPRPVRDIVALYGKIIAESGTAKLLRA